MSKFLIVLSLIGGISFLSAQDLNATYNGNHEDFTIQDQSLLIPISCNERDEFKELDN